MIWSKNKNKSNEWSNWYFLENRKFIQIINSNQILLNPWKKVKNNNSKNKINGINFYSKKKVHTKLSITLMTEIKKCIRFCWIFQERFWWKRKIFSLKNSWRTKSLMISFWTVWDLTKKWKCTNKFWSREWMISRFSGKVSSR